MRRPRSLRRLVQPCPERRKPLPGCDSYCPQQRCRSYGFGRTSSSHFLSLSSMSPYRWWKRRSKVRLVASLTTRTVACPRFSERDILAANRRRSRCVFRHGFPVLRVHFSLGFARHTGHRTANTCLGVSFSGTTMFCPILPV